MTGILSMIIQAGEFPENVRTVAAPDNEIGDNAGCVQFKGEGRTIPMVFHGAAGFDQKAPSAAAEQERNGNLHVVFIKEF